MDAGTPFGTIGTIGTEIGYETTSPYGKAKSWGKSVPTVPTLPNAAASLVADCYSLGVDLWAEGDRIRYRGPSEAISPELAGGIRTHKAAILRLLADPPNVSSARVHATDETRETPRVGPPSLADLDELPWRESMTFWSRDHRERFEERAAVLECEAGFFREEAERRAFLMLAFIPQHFEPEESGRGVATEAGPTTIPADHWRWRVANWPLDAWVVWHDLATTMMAGSPAVAPLAIQERAYRRLEAGAS